MYITIKLLYSWKHSRRTMSSKFMTARACIAYIYNHSLVSSCSCACFPSSGAKLMGAVSGTSLPGRLTGGLRSPTLSCRDNRPLRIKTLFSLLLSLPESPLPPFPLSLASCSLMVSRGLTSGSKTPLEGRPVGASRSLACSTRGDKGAGCPLPQL